MPPRARSINLACFLVATSSLVASCKTLKAYMPGGGPKKVNTEFDMPVENVTPTFVKIVVHAPLGGDPKPGVKGRTETDMPIQAQVVDTARRRLTMMATNTHRFRLPSANASSDAKEAAEENALLLIADISFFGVNAGDRSLNVFEPPSGTELQKFNSQTKGELVCRVTVSLEDPRRGYVVVNKEGQSTQSVQAVGIQSIARAANRDYRNETPGIDPLDIDNVVTEALHEALVGIMPDVDRELSRNAVTPKVE